MKPLLLLLTLLLWASPGQALNQNLRHGAWVYLGEHADCHALGGPQQPGQWLPLTELKEWQRYCIRVPLQLEQDADEATILSAVFLASATLYWDGQHLADKGRPGNQPSDEVVGPLAVQVSLSAQQLTAGDHWLSMDWSAYHHSEDLTQILYQLALVDEAEVLSVYQSLIPPWLLCGALFTLALIFALVYARYQNNPSYLMFSLLCLSAGLLLVLELIKFYWNYPWSFHLIRLRIVIPVVALTALCLVAYYLHYFQVKHKRRWLIISSIQFTLLALFTPSYDGKSLGLFLAALIISLCLSINAWRQQRAGAAQHSLLLALGLLVCALIPFSFIDQWFAALFALLALTHVYHLTGLFASDRERALQALRLEGELLRRQLQPHFLLNSLTLITEWVETQPQHAVQFIDLLAAEFRSLNQIAQHHLVPWRDERELCQQHFTVMQQRLQKPITLRIENPAGADGDDFLIPPAIIHTLVENAFAHNRWLGGDELLIRVHTQAQRVEIFVQSPQRAQQHQGSGTGERYIRARLSQCFAEDWSFQQQAGAGVWQSQLSFPRRRISP